MRYELLLKALLDYTEETHVDFQNLRDAIAAVQKVNRYIDERKKIDEQMEICEQRFKDLIAKGGGYEVLLTQGNYAQRRFVKEFQLEAIIDLSDAEKGRKSEVKPELMIFNDLILASNFMHKKATLNEAGQSLPLVWLDTEFNKRNQKVIETIAGKTHFFLLWNSITWQILILIISCWLHAWQRLLVERPWDLVVREG